jgi:hypothetical protein
VNGLPVHKAEPVAKRLSLPGAYHCRICGAPLDRVPGGQGMTWVHRDSGAVAAADPPIIVAAERFAINDPDVEWPSEKHEDPVDAICAALDRLREQMEEWRQDAIEKRDRAD